MLGMTLRVFKTRMMIECKKKGIELSLEQFVILNILNANCDLIQQDLANHLQKDKSIIVRQIDGLIEDQYVVRLTNKEDKRKKNLILTKKGFERLNEMERIASEVSKKLLTGVSDSELEIFKDVLVKIQENGELEEEAI